MRKVLIAVFIAALSVTGCAHAESAGQEAAKSQPDTKQEMLIAETTTERLMVMGTELISNETVEVKTEPEPAKETATEPETTAAPEISAQTEPSKDTETEPETVTELATEPETEPLAPKPTAAPVTETGITAGLTYGGGYYVGDTLTATAFDVRMNYSDGSSKAINGWAAYPLTLTDVDNTITIEYGKYKTTLNVKAEPYEDPWKDGPPWPGPEAETQKLTEEQELELRISNGTATLDELRNYVLAGWNHGRNGNNHQGIVASPNTLNMEWCEVAQWYAEWLTTQGDMVTDMNCHSGNALGWDLSGEGISIGLYGTLYEDAAYQVTHTALYGENIKEIGFGIAKGTGEFEGYYYLVVQNWKLEDENLALTKYLISEYDAGNHAVFEQHFNPETYQLEWEVYDPNAEDRRYVRPGRIHDD